MKPNHNSDGCWALRELFFLGTLSNNYCQLKIASRVISGFDDVAG
jgi:hypothetical protein